MKSSFVFFLGLLLCFPASTTGQNIKELFVAFPGKIFGTLPSSSSKQSFLNTTAVGQRGELQDVDPNEGTDQYTLAILDLAGGFIRLDALDFYVDMCYWRKSDGHRLVAICETTTVGYVESEIEFYDYFEGNWKRLHTDSIMIRPAYQDVLDIRASLAANGGAAIPLDRLSYATEIQLPQKGKDIQVQFELVDFADESGRELSYQLVYKVKKPTPTFYSQLVYFWNDGIFLKE
ncbi:MAG: DUF3256 family protein [Bacteroidota bacterium]